MRVDVSGDKNISLALLPAAFFAKEMVFYNLPNISDVAAETEIMKSAGSVVLSSGNSKRIITDTVSNNVVPSEPGSKIRASLYFLGAYLGRGQSVVLPHPGGCYASGRKINMHIESLRFLGADVNVTKKYIFAQKHKMKAKRIRLPIPSKGVTVNLIYSSLLLPGKTIIENASIAPEISHLISLLNSLGFDIKIHHNVIVIEGKPNHSFQNGICLIPSDRIEAGTFAVLSLLLRQELSIMGIDYQDIDGLQKLLDSVNTRYSIEGNAIHISRNQHLKPATVSVGFPPEIDPDYGPIIVPLLCLIKGNSYIVDHHNTHRINDVLSQLGQLGAEYRQISENAFLIRGIDHFCGNGHLVGKEIRGTMAMVLASLVNHGNVTVSGLTYINRAYDGFVEKIGLLGLSPDLS